jgi:hypothetical protein
MLRLAIALALTIMSVLRAVAQQPADPEIEARLLRSRATQAVIWGMPAVNTMLMYDQMIAAGGKAGEIIYWGRPLDWHNQTLTPNPDTLYFMGFYDTRADGPMVVKIPPAGKDGSLNANFVTLWQTSLEDAGLLGVDKGAGIRFVITPPGYEGKVPEGFERLAADTYTGYFLLRSNLKSHAAADVKQSVAYAKRAKFYPLSKIDVPPETVFRDVKDTDFDSTIRYDLSFFSLLDRVIQSEPWLARDRAMIDQEKYAVDARGISYSYAYISIKRLGVGQFYLINIKDKTGESYDGGRNYKLHVPADVPVEQYWSVTVYDRETHALVKGVDRASRASNAAEVKKNADGSVDLYFGPSAPAGQETNWVPTVAGRRFELMFRLYAPIKRLFDKAWRLPDVEPL